MISKSLTLPDGYQTWDQSWFRESGWPNNYGAHLNHVRSLKKALNNDGEAEARLYTHHEIFYEEDVLKQTRSSPNWEGGLVTYATCKHLLRTYHGMHDWPGKWLAGLCPAHCADNCVLYVGRVQRAFQSNYHLNGWLLRRHRDVWRLKRADRNPRGDLYSVKPWEMGHGVYCHETYSEPPQHTRSVEFYKSSPGSVSDRPDGLIPKWWRDVEYEIHGKRPPVFVLNPVWLFSRPLAWCSLRPGRAALKLTAAQLAAALTMQG